MRIAVCDDQELFVNEISEKIKEHLDSQNYNYQIDVFDSGLKLISSNKYINQYDLIFLDVEMPCASGEYVAGELLKDNKKNTLIVFTTSHTEFAKYGYMYRAFRFIDKAELDEELKGVLDDSVKELMGMPENEIINIDSNDICIKDIVSIIADGQSTNIILNNDKRITVKQSLKSFVSSVKFTDFIRVRRGLYINFDYIASIEDNFVKLDDGSIIEFSRSEREKFKQRAYEIIRRKDD